MDGTSDRRQFLKTAAVIAAGTAVAAHLRPTAAIAKDEPWVAVLGKVKDLNEKQPVLVKAQFKDADGNVVDAEKLYVRWEQHGKSGSWVVLSSICTHLKCKVDFVEDEDVFRCPCHGSEFDIGGHRTKKPAKKDLPDYSDLAYEEDGLLKLKREPEK